MKIVKIHGGLGNQMFQYAFALRLRAEGLDEVFIDTGGFRDLPAHNGFELAKIFRIELPEAPADAVARLAVRPRGLLGRFRRKYLGKPSHVIDRKFGYQPELLGLEGDRYFEGYWQSEKYFLPISEEIRRVYRFVPQLSERNARMIAEARRPAVSIHIRRGDYLAHDNLNLCSPRYYDSALKALEEEIGPGHGTFIFSDDAEYCRTELGGLAASAVMVDWNRGEESWQDMAMMSACDHHVIANSSFSWWAAWLDGKAGTRVFAPAIWNRREIEDRDKYYSYTFEDVVPANWRRIGL